MSTPSKLANRLDLWEADRQHSHVHQTSETRSKLHRTGPRARLPPAHSWQKSDGAPTAAAADSPQRLEYKKSDVAATVSWRQRPAENVQGAVPTANYNNALPSSGFVATDMIQAAVDDALALADIAAQQLAASPLQHPVPLSPFEHSAMLSGAARAVRSVARPALSSWKVSGHSGGGEPIYRSRQAAYTGPYLGAPSAVVYPAALHHPALHQSAALRAHVNQSIKEGLVHPEMPLVSIRPHAWTARPQSPPSAAAVVGLISPPSAARPQPLLQRPLSPPMQRPLSPPRLPSIEQHRHQAERVSGRSQCY